MDKFFSFLPVLLFSLVSLVFVGLFAQSAQAIDLDSYHLDNLYAYNEDFDSNELWINQSDVIISRVDDRYFSMFLTVHNDSEKVAEKLDVQCVINKFKGGNSVKMQKRVDDIKADGRTRVRFNIGSKLEGEILLCFLLKKGRAVVGSEIDVKIQIDTLNYWQKLDALRLSEVKKVVRERSVFKSYLRSFRDYKDAEDLLSKLNDENARILSEDEMEDFKIPEGRIGIEIAKFRDGSTRITQVLDGSPADKDGLMVGDVILSVNKYEALRRGDIFELQRRIWGEANKKVELFVRRDGFNSVFTILRKKMEVHPVEFSEENGYYLLKVPIFNQNNTLALNEYLDDMRGKDVRGITIDLRNNPGGVLEEVIKSLEFFVEEDTPLVWIKGSWGSALKLSKEDPIVNNVPIIILVNSQTSSGAEMFARVMQQLKLAKIMGERTSGVNTVLEYVALKDGSYLQLTTGFWAIAQLRLEFRARPLRPNYRYVDNYRTYQRDEAVEKAKTILLRRKKS